jgi:uncharacterized protein (DUF736 family)
LIACAQRAFYWGGAEQCAPRLLRNARSRAPKGPSAISTTGSAEAKRERIRFCTHKHPMPRSEAAMRPSAGALTRLLGRTAEEGRGKGKVARTSVFEAIISGDFPMNIGSIKQNDAGIFVGKIATLTIAMTIALREVHSANPKAPKYEVLALSASRAWVQVGALFELFSNGTGEAFLNGKIEDPSLVAPLYVSAFRQEDGSYNVVWSRPTRRRDLASEMAPKSEDALPPLPGADDASAAPARDADAGLGQSSSEHAFAS